jgi:hypothetical protein
LVDLRCRPKIWREGEEGEGKKGKRKRGEGGGKRGKRKEGERGKRKGKGEEKRRKGKGRGRRWGGGQVLKFQNTFERGGEERRR